MRDLSTKILSSLALARSGVYALEWVPINLFGRLFSGDADRPTEEEMRAVWPQLKKLHEREARNIVDGVYPLSALESETPWGHARAFAGVLTDGLRVAWRMKSRNHADFSERTKSDHADLPAYYTRNFHFQTDGYLSESSARRYEHQVNILFAGGAGAMRRLILPPLKKHAAPAGRFLELGAGTGAATRPVLATFPKSRVTALDLSGPYLKVAQERLRKFPRVDYAQGDATNLSYKDASFDAVYSVYVMHELPGPERAAMVREAYRVLKPGGVLVLADSIQMGDEPVFDRALERFPQAYHEPFYKNYQQTPVEDLVRTVSGVEPERDHALFTKVVWVTKPN